MVFERCVLTARLDRRLASVGTVRIFGEVAVPRTETVTGDQTSAAPFTWWEDLEKSGTHYPRKTEPST